MSGVFRQILQERLMTIVEGHMGVPDLAFQSPCWSDGAMYRGGGLTFDCEHEY